jgi:hypothetical protein
MNDSTNETQAHIDRVRELLKRIVVELEVRADVHDASKLQEPEKSAFDQVVGRLKEVTYGSPEYKATLKDVLGAALHHHDTHNSHHPEHRANGVDGMSLLDLVEMFCDWKAAGERHLGGSLERSIQINRERFKISDQLTAILENTRKELNW